MTITEFLVKENIANIFKNRKINIEGKFPKKTSLKILCNNTLLNKCSPSIHVKSFAHGGHRTRLIYFPGRVLTSTPPEHSSLPRSAGGWCLWRPGISNFKATGSCRKKLVAFFVGGAWPQESPNASRQWKRWHIRISPKYPASGKKWAPLSVSFMRKGLYGKFSCPAISC